MRSLVQQTGRSLWSHAERRDRSYAVLAVDEPITLAFRDIRYTVMVPPKDGQRGVEPYALELLQGVTGFAKPATLTDGVWRPKFDVHTGCVHPVLPVRHVLRARAHQLLDALEIPS